MVSSLPQDSVNSPSHFPSGERTSVSAVGGGMSLSSSTMSLGSGLTVILDQQLSSASAPPSHPPWNAAAETTTRRRSSGTLGPRKSIPAVPETARSCEMNQGLLTDPPPPPPPPPPFPSVRLVDVDLDLSSCDFTATGRDVRRDPPRPRRRLNNRSLYPRYLVGEDIMHNPQRNRGLNLLTSALQEIRRSSTNNNNNNNGGNTILSNSSSIPPRRGSIITSEAFSHITGYVDEEDDPIFPSHEDRYQLSSKPPLTQQYYNFNLCNRKTIKITFDRLALLSLLDRNFSVCENIFNVLLVLAVGALGCLILQLGLYQELKVLLFCIVMASSQYSLFKSVQPDAASPIHGYNHIILYSRALYFIFCCSCVLMLHWVTKPSYQPLPNFTLYGICFSNLQLLYTLKDIFLVFLLFFPFIFSLGLLPQVNTFLMYSLEQIDIHIFGGNGTTSLSSAIYCVARSCFAVACLYGFAHGGLQEDATPTENSDPSNSGKRILYAIFCGLTLGISYHLSRSGADYTALWQLLQRHVFPEELSGAGGIGGEDRLAANTKTEGEVNSSQMPTNGASGAATDSPEANNKSAEDGGDPLPEKLRSTVLSRLTHDMLVCSLMSCFVFLITSITSLPSTLKLIHPLALWLPPVVLGFLLHYIIPQLRKQQPWLCVARPVCMQAEYSNYEVYDSATVMWFEKLFVWLCLFEKNVVYPALFLCALIIDSPNIMKKHDILGPLLIVMCGLKCFRSAYSYPPSQYLILAFTKLFFAYDFNGLSETFLVDYFLMSIIYCKTYEFLLKLKFIVTYIAPWQITWGSAFHAFAQPFSVPHSAMLFLQAAISAILSTPLNPVLGSAIFITSYVRPVKFWERDYNTKRMDQSNTRLSTSLLDHNPGADDNNLNSIFYEHLTRSLQHSLCGDLLMGKSNHFKLCCEL